MAVGVFFVILAGLWLYTAVTDLLHRFNSPTTAVGSENTDSTAVKTHESGVAKAATVGQETHKETPPPSPSEKPKQGSPVQPEVSTTDRAEKPSPSPSEQRKQGIPEAPEPRPFDMRMMLIPAGTLDMGAPAGEPDAAANEKPRHPVNITRPFYMGVHEVTHDQFAQFVSEAKFTLEGGEKWKSPPWRLSAVYPVVNVTWNDAVAFCRWLSRKQGRTYRLPTEAEWEYACTAVLPDANHANYRQTDKKAGKILPVGSLQPNKFGLYDMQGNVWEWCSDWYDAGYYSTFPKQDPPGPASGTLRVTRGGGWRHFWRDCRPSLRLPFEPSKFYDDRGFRVVMETTGPSARQPDPSARPNPANADVEGPVYLTELAPIEVRILNDPFGLTLHKTAVVKGVRFEKSLGMHPVWDYVQSHAAFDLHKRGFRSFKGAVAINDSATPGSMTALTFRVVGDRKLLWKSSPLRERGATQEFCTNIEGVRRLDLFVACPGPAHYAHANWLDPHLLRTPCPAGTQQQNPQPAVATEPDLISGLVAELCEGVFERRVKTRLDSHINWDRGAPDKDLRPEHFSIRWSGWLRAPKLAEYTLITDCDDGVRLWLDGLLLINSWTQLGPQSATAWLDTEPREIHIEYVQTTGPSRLVLKWAQKDGFPAQVIPANALFHDREQATLLPSK